MKKLLSIILSCLSGLSLLSASAKPELSSFKPGELLPDDKGVHVNAHGAGMYFEKGTYYLFGEHKVEGDAGNYAQVGVHCYSSKDLYNWKDEGIALKVVEGDDNHPIAKGCILERPKVIYNKKTKKYVMWFHLELKGKGYGSAYAGVATADKVTGPYKFLRAGRVNPGKWPENMPKEDRTLAKGSEKDEGEYKFFKRDFEKGQMSRDMTLFVDDDGKAYHIYSSEENGTQQIAELTPDFTGHSGKYTRHFVGRHMEAAAICKRNGKYYFIGSGCTGWAPNKARMAVADKIMGPWKELDNPCTGPRSEITFGGQSTYIQPIQGKKDAYLFMADLWRPQNAIDGRYMWLPMEFEGDQIRIKWLDEWNLDHFKKEKK